MAALALAAVGGTRRETSVALAAVASQSVFPSLIVRCTCCQTTTAVRLEVVVNIPNHLVAVELRRQLK